MTITDWLEDGEPFPSQNHCLSLILEWVSDSNTTWPPHSVSNGLPGPVSRLVH